MDTVVEGVISEKDIDYMDFVDNEIKEADLIRDLHQEDIEENCFRLTIKDCKTGKKILRLITDQITIDQEFDMDTGQDIMILKVLLSIQQIEENGDADYLENLEKFSEKYWEE